jgi:hypothetical protein
MDRLLRFFFFSIMLSLLAASGSAQTGLVDGHIVDADGKAVFGATVSVMSLDKTDSGRPPSSLTDEEGKFILASLPIGKYRIYVWKDADGVPNARMVLFESSNPHYSEVTIRANEISHANTIKLPPPYGRLTLHIVDAKTKLPIALSRCTLTRMDVPNRMYATDSIISEFSFLLPDSPISLRITSSGYKDWSYVGSSSLGPYFISAPGGDVTMIVALEADVPRTERKPDSAP